MTDLAILWSLVKLSALAWTAFLWGNCWAERSMGGRDD